MLETIRKSLQWDAEPFPKMLYQSMNLARLFSFLGERRFVESLFCIGLARLEDPSNRVQEGCCVLLVRRSCTSRGRCSEKCNLSCNNVGDIGGQPAQWSLGFTTAGRNQAGSRKGEGIRDEPQSEVCSCSHEDKAH
jgi:hypothetical protein